MAFGIIHHFPGGTEKQYDATLRAVHVSDTGLPEGQIFHAAGLGRRLDRGGDPRFGGQLERVP